VRLQGASYVEVFFSKKKEGASWPAIIPRGESGEVLIMHCYPPQSTIASVVLKKHHGRRIFETLSPRVDVNIRVSDARVACNA